MTTKRVVEKIKKHWWSWLFYGLILVFIFSPDAKSWLLQQLVATGFFNAEIKKEAVNRATASASFNFVDVLGKQASINDLKGKVVFINFWASWCPPCRAEMPSMEKLYQKLGNDPRFAFIFINEDEDKSKAINYLKKNKFTMPLSYSIGVVPGDVFNGTLPTTLVMDKEGKIVFRQTGMADYDSEKFISELMELL